MPSLEDEILENLEALECYADFTPRSLKYQHSAEIRSLIEEAAYNFRALPEYRRDAFTGLLLATGMAVVDDSPLKILGTYNDELQLIAVVSPDGLSIQISRTRGRTYAYMVEE